MYQALPFVKKRDLYSGFFEKFSMSYRSFLVVSQGSANWTIVFCSRVRSVASWSVRLFLTEVQLSGMRLAVTQGVLVLYPFLWLKLYQHVFKQRKSKLGKGSRKKRAWENLALLSSAQLPLVAVMWNANGSLWILFWKITFVSCCLMRRWRFCWIGQ